MRQFGIVSIDRREIFCYDDVTVRQKLAGLEILWQAALFFGGKSDI